jgi:chromosome segregation ATPase
MTPVAQTVDWSQFWQPIMSALPGLILAVLAFVTAIFGGAALSIRAMVKSTAGKETAYLEMVKNNNEELKQLRGDLRESDRREVTLRDEIHQVRVDGDRKMGEMTVESDQKMAAMKRDYEARIAGLETTIEDLQAQLATKEIELGQERKARKDADTARSLAEMQRDKDHADFKLRIGQFEQKIAALERQVKEQKNNTAELKAAQENPGE